MTRKIPGFTLIELIIVVVLVLILGSVALVRYSSMIEKARSAEAYAVLADIAASENGYYVEYNAYTSTWANLDRYTSAPVSENFTFTLASNYAMAASTKGGNNYCMSFNGTKMTCP